MADYRSRKPPADPRYAGDDHDGVFPPGSGMSDLFADGPAPAPVHEFIDSEAATRVSDGRQLFASRNPARFEDDLTAPPAYNEGHWPDANAQGYQADGYQGEYYQPLHGEVVPAPDEAMERETAPVADSHALALPGAAPAQDAGYTAAREGFSWIRENAADHVSPPSPDLVMLSNADGYAAAQFRALRYRLEQEPNVQVVVVASARERDGRSVTAANLALALAEGGRIRVLLVDAALRNPAQHKLFGIRGDLGLTSVLAARQNDPSLPIDVIRISTSLSLIPAGPPVQSAYAALSSEPAAVFMAQIRKEYRFIVVDSSPVFGTAETLAWHGMIDKYVLLARAGKTTAEDLTRACERLQREKILGVSFLGAALRRE